MVLSIFNWNILKEYSPNTILNEEKIIELIKDIFVDQNSSKISLIFTSSRDIKMLNSEFRNKNDVTDVLSFNIDENNILGEIYICPEYVSKTYKGEEFDKEILRLLVHGILHILGYDHTGEFDENNTVQEKMFVKQEEILENILNKLK